jgi:lipopolysaccharide export system protein LptA
MLSIFFIVVALCIVVALGIFIISAQKLISGIDVNFKGKDNIFSEVTFKTKDDKGRDLNLFSDKVSEIKKDNFIFENMTLTFILSNGENGIISADITKAIRSDQTLCEFTGNVRLKTDAGLLIESEKSLVDFSQKIAMGDTGIMISRKDVKASSQKYFFDTNKNILTLIGNVKCFLRSDKITSDKMIVCFAEEYGKSVQSMEAIGNASYVSANYHLQARKNIIHSGNNIEAHNHVILLYKRNSNDYDVKSDHMQALLDEHGVIENIVATGSLIIKTKDATIRGNRGVFKGNIVTVRDNVMVFSNQGNIFGDVAVLNISSGDISVNNSSGVIDDKRRAHE